MASRKLFCHALLLLALSFSISGQQKKEIVTVDEPPTSYREVGQAQVSYWSSSDTTEIRSEWNAFKSDKLSAGMWLVVTAKGKSSLQPKIVAVNLGLKGEKARLEKLEGFALEPDQRIVKVSNPSFDEGLENNQYFKHFHGSMSFEDFEDLVSARSVKVHTGDVVFELSKQNMDALRDMLKAIKQ